MDKIPISDNGSQLLGDFFALRLVSGISTDLPTHGKTNKCHGKFAAISL